MVFTIKYGGVRFQFSLNISYQPTLLQVTWRSAHRSRFAAGAVRCSWADVLDFHLSQSWADSSITSGLYGSIYGFIWIYLHIYIYIEIYIYIYIYIYGTPPQNLCRLKFYWYLQWILYIVAPMLFRLNLRHQQWENWKTKKLKNWIP